MYDEFDQVYCYEQSEVLINNFNVQDPEQLKEIERLLTGARLLELYKKPLKGKFDVNHLKRIHFHIFQDIYSWAGQFRIVDISKGTLFCHAEFIEKEVKKLLTQLKKENFLQGLETPRTIERAAYFLAEINAIHPFRDGNGRAQREFLRELMLSCGYHVDYSKIEPKAMIDVSIASYAGDNGPLIKLLNSCTVKTSELDSA